MALFKVRKKEEVEEVNVEVISKSVLVTKLATVDSYLISCPWCNKILGANFGVSNITERLNDYRNYVHCIYCGEKLSWDITLNKEESNEPQKKS